MHFFVGTKNPPMPPNLHKSEAKPLKLLCEKFGKGRINSEKDFVSQGNIDQQQSTRLPWLQHQSYYYRV